MSKKLEIIGLFNNSQIRRAFGDMLADTNKAKGSWSELQNKIKSSQSSIASDIRQATADLKKEEAAIASLQRRMANPLNSSWKKENTDKLKAHYDEVNAIKKVIKENENLARSEKLLGIKQQVKSGAASIGMTALRVGGIAATAAMVAGGAMINNYLPFDKQQALLENTLHAKNSDTKSLVKNQVWDVSSSTGKDSAEVAAAYTQLFSSGLAPTAKEGTKEYVAQLQEAKKVLEAVGQASVATGENMGSMQTALVYTASAFGKNLHSSKDVQEILDSMSVTLDQGIGTMSQYTGEFSKFGPAAKAAKVDMKDSMAVFALMTKSYSPGEAGHATKAFFEEMATPEKAATRAQQYIARSAKKDLIVGTDKDKEILEGFADKKTGAKKVQDFFMDSNGNNRKMTDTLGRINETFKSLTSDSARNSFLTMISGNNATQLKAFRVMTGMDAGTDENGNVTRQSGVNTLDDIISKYNATEGAISEKIKNTNEHMSQKMALLGANFSVNMQRFTASLEPIINDSIDFLIIAANKLPKIGDAITQALGYGTKTIEQGGNTEVTGMQAKVDEAKKAAEGKSYTDQYNSIASAMYQADTIQGVDTPLMHLGGTKDEAYAAMSEKIFGYQNSLHHMNMMNPNDPDNGKYGFWAGMSAKEADPTKQKNLWMLQNGGNFNIQSLVAETGGTPGAKNAINAALEYSKTVGDKGGVERFEKSLTLLNQYEVARQAYEAEQNGQMTDVLRQQVALLSIIAAKDPTFSPNIMQGVGTVLRTGTEGSGLKLGAVPGISNPLNTFLGK